MSASAAAPCGMALPFRHPMKNKLRLRLSGRGAASKNYLVHTNGKPKTYRTVLRQSRELILTAQTGADIQPS